MIDIGVNLLHAQFDADREKVIERARAAGVSRMLLTSTDLHTSQRALDFCATRSDIRCTAGIHPHDAKDAGPQWQSALRSIARSPFVKAIGETGLDYHRNFSPPAQQRAVFGAQLDIAQALGKPVFVHDREAAADVLAGLSEHSLLGGVVVHCFTGSLEELDAYLAAGFYIGITGWICDKRRGQPLRDIVTRIPLSHLLIETDAPFLLPHNTPACDLTADHGRRNEPAFLRFVVAQLEELYAVDGNEIVAATSRNARTLFDWP